MDNIIKKILEIDKNAVDIKESTEEIIKLKDRELEERLLTIEQDNLHEAKERGNNEYQKIINEGEREAEQIIKKGDSKIRGIEEIFDTKLANIQKIIFEQLFSIKD